MPTTDKAKRREQYLRYIQTPGVRERRRLATNAWAKENKRHLLAKGAERRLNKRALCLIATTRTRAKKRGLEFDLHLYVDQLQARIDAGKCELTGQRFDLSPGRKFNSPSLDRIDPSKGYTFDNVRIVLNVINVALGDWGEETLRLVMSQWLATNAIVPPLAAEFVGAYLETEGQR
jgi:hypothetical protein